MIRPPQAPGRSLVRAALRFAAAGGLALALSGCISLLPSSKPAQLYRFSLPPAPAPAAPADAVRVFHGPGFFQRESAGDRILTVTGERAAYVAQARWVAPAEVLFDEAMTNAFEASGGRARLVWRGEPAHSDFALRVDVRNFETDYSGDAPSVLVRVRAIIARSDRTPVAERVFEARAPAAENRLSAIVAAYDQALAKVLGEMVAWTNASVS
jgi:cholesterol transport system auxiliary component